MQIILLEKIHHLGELGDVVKVKDGYARNFLIPQGHAKRATKAAIAEFETRRAELEKAQAERIAAAQAIADTLNGAEIEIASKCGVDAVSSVPSPTPTSLKRLTPSSIFRSRSPRSAPRSVPSRPLATT